MLSLSRSSFTEKISKIRAGTNKRNRRQLLAKLKRTWTRYLVEKL